MIDEKALRQKIEAFAKTDKGKKLINQKIEFYAGGGNGGKTVSGTRIRTEGDMNRAAIIMIEIMKRNAREAGLPASVMEHFNDLHFTAPVKLPGGDIWIGINFEGDLHRDSLENDEGLGYDGIDNIVALFNNGYHAKNYAYGWWNGHHPSNVPVNSIKYEDYAWVRSKKEREALRFIQQSIADFNGNYSADYGVTAVAAPIYDE